MTTEQENALLKGTLSEILRIERVAREDINQEGHAAIDSVLKGRLHDQWCNIIKKAHRQLKKDD